MIRDVETGKDVQIPRPELVNLYECKIGNGSKVAPFVEIQKGASIGENTTVSSHSFVCEGVDIGDNCFIAHGVVFTNDKFDSGDISNWSLKKTKVGNNVRIGSNATILPVDIGDDAIIGAGSVVTKDVPAQSVVYGNPAKIK
jgi:acetyltransferase-like isoleucine patch superfamily enzyme